MGVNSIVFYEQFPDEESGYEGVKPIGRVLERDGKEGE